MHSRIGCICLAFLHCGFSNVSSNGLPERMQNHTGSICSILCHFLSFSWRFPQFVCLSRDFQEFLPFPFSALNCAAPNGYFLILRQILGSRRYKISEEKGKWKYQKFTWYFSWSPVGVGWWPNISWTRNSAIWNGTWKWNTQYKKSLHCHCCSEIQDHPKNNLFFHESSRSSWHYY